jgi:hypothetical protein
LEALPVDPPAVTGRLVVSDQPAIAQGDKPAVTARDNSPRSRRFFSN